MVSLLLLDDPAGSGSDVEAKGLVLRGAADQRLLAISGNSPCARLRETACHCGSSHAKLLIRRELLSCTKACQAIELD